MAVGVIIGLVRARLVKGEVGGAVIFVVVAVNTTDGGVGNAGDKAVPLLLFLLLFFLLLFPLLLSPFLVPGLVSMSELTLAKSASGSPSPCSSSSSSG